jgi:hypothetical protein
MSDRNHRDCTCDDYPTSSCPVHPPLPSAQMQYSQQTADNDGMYGQQTTDNDRMYGPAALYINDTPMKYLQ